MGSNPTRRIYRTRARLEPRHAFIRTAPRGKKCDPAPREAAATPARWPKLGTGGSQGGGFHRCPYVLAEAKAANDGLNLGPVGGRIVTETLIGLLRGDPTSYLSVNPGFNPFLATDLQLGSTPVPNITGNRTYTRAHFLHYAGVATPATYR